MPNYWSILYLDCGGDSICVYNYQNLSNVHFKRMQFIVHELFLNKVKKII